MTQEQEDLIARWFAGEQTPELFSKIVRETTTFFLHLKAQLAAEQEVGLSTIRRWANGITRPHPLIQNHVVQNIDRLIRN